MGKSVQVYTTPDEVDNSVKHVGAKGLLIICGNVTRSQAETLVDTYR